MAVNEILDSETEPRPDFSTVTDIMAESAACKALQVLDALLAGSTHGRARQKDDNWKAPSLSSEKNPVFFMWL